MTFLTDRYVLTVLFPRLHILKVDSVEDVTSETETRQAIRGHFVLWNPLTYLVLPFYILYGYLAADEFNMKFGE